MTIQKALRSIDDRVYAIPSKKRFVVHAIYIANTTSATRRVRLHHCMNGRPSGTDNAIFYDVAVAPNGTLIDSTRFVMDEGDVLRGKSDADGVTVTIHGTDA